MEENQKTLVTVVIPVYNMEKYITKCVTSILNQKYRNIEVVAINDGSTDSSKEILDDFAQRDKRLRVITTENRGLSAARNKGIVESKGEYIVFIDADDYISDEYVDVLLDVCESKKVPISQCFYKTISAECNEDIFEYEEVKESDIKVYNDREMILNLYNHMMLPSTLTWTKMYKRDLFNIGPDTLDVFDENHIAFPEGRIYEDDYVSYRLFHKAGKVAVVNKVMYAYRKNPDGITNGPFSIKGMDLMLSLEERIRFYKKRGDRNIVNLTYRRYYYEICRTIYKTKRSKGNIPEWRQVVKELNRKKRKTLLMIIKVLRFEDKSFVRTQLIKVKCFVKMFVNN